MTIERVWIGQKFFSGIFFRYKNSLIPCIVSIQILVLPDKLEYDFCQAIFPSINIRKGEQDTIIIDATRLGKQEKIIPRRFNPFYTIFFISEEKQSRPV